MATFVTFVLGTPELLWVLLLHVVTASLKLPYGIKLVPARKTGGLLSGARRVSALRRLSALGGLKGPAPPPWLQEAFQPGLSYKGWEPQHPMSTRLHVPFPPLLALHVLLCFRPLF
jgi:hypothetical protein